MTDRMTAAPSGWLTEERLDWLQIDVTDDRDRCPKYAYITVGRDEYLTLIAMARWSLSHQAALETATDLPLGEVIAAWRAVKKCTDEFLPEYPGACEEYKSVLHEQLNALEAKR